MAMTNLPYDDEAIAKGLHALQQSPTQVDNVMVNFLSEDLTSTGQATIRVTSTWTVTASEALAILDAARPDKNTTP
jgi:primosomal protein N''